MAPRKRIIAVLSCDPSWRGLAFILHIPSLGYNRSFLYDLKEYDKSKQFKHPKRTIVSIQRIFDEMFEKEERMNLIDKIIMESQHKTNMQILSWLLISNLLPRLGNASVEYISPLTCKGNFDIALTGTHHGNKVAAVNFVEKSKNGLVASETVTENNTADACLLLNTYIQTTKNHLINNIDEWSSMSNLVKVSYSGEPGTKLVCPKCKNNTGVIRKCTDPEKKNFNKHFLTCWWEHDKGTESAKRCGNFKALYENIPKIVNGFVDKTWKVVSDEADEEVSYVGQKRKTEEPKEKDQPQRKKVAPAPAPKPVPGENLKNLDGQQVISGVSVHLKKVCDALKNHIDMRINELYMKFELRLDKVEDEVRNNGFTSAEVLTILTAATQEQTTQIQEDNAETEQTKLVSSEELDQLIVEY